MLVSELIEKLSKFPPHYSVETLNIGVEVEDLESDIVEVEIHDPYSKTVNLIITPL